MNAPIPIKLTPALIREHLKRTYSFNTAHVDRYCNECDKHGYEDTLENIESDFEQYIFFWMSAP
jgi:hypothetical protein